MLSLLFVSLIQWFLHTYCWTIFQWTDPMWFVPSHNALELALALCGKALIDTCLLHDFFCLLMYSKVVCFVYVLCALSSPPFLSSQPTSLYFWAIDSNTFYIQPVGKWKMLIRTIQVKLARNRQPGKRLSDVKVSVHECSPEEMCYFFNEK